MPLTPLRTVFLERHSWQSFHEQTFTTAYYYFSTSTNTYIIWCSRGYYDKEKDEEIPVTLGFLKEKFVNNGDGLAMFRRMIELYANIGQIFDDNSTYSRKFCELFDPGIEYRLYHMLRVWYRRAMKRLINQRVQEIILCSALRSDPRYLLLLNKLNII